MRTVKSGMCVAALAACCLAVAPAAKPDLTPEEKWTRRIADDFWRALASGQAEQAAGLLSPTLSRSLVAREWSGHGDNARLLDLPPGKWLASHLPVRDLVVSYGPH